MRARSSCAASKDVAHRHALTSLEQTQRLGPILVDCPTSLDREDIKRTRIIGARPSSGRWLIAVMLCWGNDSPENCSACGTPYHSRGAWRWVNCVALELADERTPTAVLAGLSHAEASAAWHFREYNVQLASSEAAIASYRAGSATCLESPARKA